MSQTSSPPPLSAWRARRWPKVLAGILLLLGGLQGAAYLYLPGLIQREAAAWARSIGYRLTLDEVRVLPWQLRLELGPWRLADAGGSQLLSGQGAVLDASLWPLVLGRYQIAEFSLVAPQLVAERDAGGVWNWARFVHAAQRGQPDKQDGTLPRVLIEEARLTQGHIVLRDAFAGPLRVSEARNLNLALSELSTEAADGVYRLSALLGGGARLSWQGSLALAPLASHGQLRLQALPLASVWQWFAPVVRLAPPQGVLSAASSYRFSLRGTQPQLQLDGLQLSLSDLGLTAPASGNRLQLAQLEVGGGKLDLARQTLSLASIRLRGADAALTRYRDGRIDWQAALPASQAQTSAPTPGWTVDVAKAELQDARYRYQDQGFAQPLLLSGQLPQASAAWRLDRHGQLSVTRVAASLSEVALGQAGAAPLLRLAQARLEGASADTHSRRLTLGELALSGLEVDVERERQGQINLARLFARTTPARAEAAASASPWRIAYPQLVLDGGRVRWRDLTLAQPAQLELAQVGGTLRHDEGGLEATLAAAIGRGRLKLDARLPDDFRRVEAELALHQVPLASLAPYVLSGTPLRMQGGSLSARLGGQVQGEDFSLRGQARIDSLAVFEPGQRQALLGWRALELRGLTVDNRRASIAEVRLQRPVARFILDETRVSNIQRLLAGRSRSTPATVASADKPFPVFVRTLRIQSATLDFADLAMKPVFGTRIHDLSGTVLGLSSLPGRRGTVSLAGEVDEYGDVRIRGALQPFALTDDLDMQLAFRNIPIHSLNPYSMSFAGWKVEDGRLSVDLAYRLEQRKLRADNRVVIKSLKLGDELPDYQGTKLPLRLAVALLEDSDGVIDLDLPVTGSLDDPKFSVGRLVWQAVKNVITKVATAPFRALAALMGGEGFDEIYAVPGEAAVSPPEREKLAKLAELLAKRPQLTVELAGRYDAKADRGELARARIDRAILLQAGFGLQAGEPLPLPDSADPAIAAATRSVYAARIGRLKLMQRLLALPDTPARAQALREELIAAETVGDAELKALAQARALAAQRVLLQGDAALAARVSLGEVQQQRADANGIALGLKLGRAALAAAPAAPAAATAN